MSVLPNFDVFLQVIFQKNLMNRFGARFNNVDFEPKNGAFTQFQAKQEIFSEKASSVFNVY